MARGKKNRHVGIVGIGETKFSSHREDVNQPEMIHEAVRQALDDAGLTIQDVDCVVHGNMELFEMVHQPDMWHVLGTGAYGKDSFRITTGGTTGGTLVGAADNLVASGMYDVVLAIGFEKLQEGHTTGGITNMADPLWARKLQSGALTDSAAVKLIEEFGEERAKRAAMTYRIIMDQHACLNPNSHRAFGLDWDQMEDLMADSPPLIGNLRLIHMCSQSDGACALIFAAEERARQIAARPVWIRASPPFGHRSGSAITSRCTAKRPSTSAPITTPTTRPIVLRRSSFSPATGSTIPSITSMSSKCTTRQHGGAWTGCGIFFCLKGMPTCNWWKTGRLRLTAGCPSIRPAG